MDRHSTVDRTPETVLEHWDTPLKLNGQLLPPPPPETKSEAERFLAWLKARRSYSGNTLHWYMVAFRQLCCLTAVKLKKSPRELTYEDYLELRPKYPEPVRLYFRFLWEVTGDERYKRVYERIRAPQKRKRLPEALTREQVEKLLEECGREDPELKVLVALIYETGARAGEILRLKARDVEFDEYGARIWIRRSKSEARVLRVALYAQLLAAWLETRKPQPDEPIFTREYNSYLRRLSAVWRRLGLPQTRQKFHILRHTRATELLKARVFTEREMMMWFGWRTRAMIDVYAKVTMADVEQAYLAAVKGVEVKKEEPPKPKACPRCKALNPPEAKFCLRCAAPLELPAAAAEYKEQLLFQAILERLEKLERAYEKREKEKL